MKKMLFIYNPNSGMGLLKPKLSDVLDIFVKGGYEVTVYPTQKYHDAVRKMAEYEEQYDLVACSGGDGTLDEVVTGMMKREDKVPIGYIPAGTTNDFASSLHISKNMLEAADTVVNGVPFACDVGEFNEDYFVYIAAFGLFTDVSYETKQSMKNVLGHLAYILEGTKRIFNIPSYRIKVTHDGETIEDEFIYGMVTNSRSVGGFKGITGTKKVLLMPFMFVAGDHAKNDIAGDWKEELEKKGYEVSVFMEGLGQNPDIQKIFIEHARFMAKHKMIDIVDKKKAYAVEKD